jgi:SET and MYND domain-containing protein
VAVLSRLHLNTFKVQNVLLSLDWDEGINAAAAALQEDSTGSALYLLASLLNHSCEPSVNVAWPANNGTAAFTAARDISAGEQLHVSYIDCEQEVSTRQEFLAWSYGFRCRCAKCAEELADAAKRERPRL